MAPEGFTGLFEDFEERFDDVDRHREDDGRILLGTDLVSVCR